MKLKKLLLYFFLNITCLVLVAQQEEIVFKHISTLHGLSQSSVIVTHQDKLGQMWFGTRDGLNKFDGKNFTVYRNIVGDANSISNNDILSIIEDNEGFLWIGTYNGLNRYNPKKNSFTTFFHTTTKNSLSNNTIWSLKEVSTGEIWVGTSRGLSIYSKKTGEFTNVYRNSKNANSLVNNFILTITQTKDKNIWLGTKAGLSKFESNINGDFAFENYNTLNNSTKPIWIQNIIEDSDNNLLLGSRNNGVLKLNTTTKKVEKYLSEKGHSVISKNVRQLMFDQESTLWVGTYKGLFLVDKNEQIKTIKANSFAPESISKNSVKSIYKDKKGSIWVGTYYGGVNIWDKANNNFLNFCEQQISRKLNYNVVGSIAQYKNILIFGTEGQGINFYNTQTDKITYLNPTNKTLLPSNNIKALFVENDNLWIGTLNKGIALYDLKTKQFKNNIINAEIYNILQNVGVYSITKDKNNTYWFGTFGQGVFNFNPETKQIKTYKNTTNSNSISNNLVRSVFVDATNAIWVSTQVGLNKITNSKKVERFFYDNNVESGDDIATTYQDKENTIWVGTKAKGLFKLTTNKTFENIILGGNRDAFSNISGILEDKERNLWISTNNGIVKYGVKAGNTTVYNQKDGLVGNEFNNNVSLKLGDSNFYFGGPSGVTSFNTANFNMNTYNPQVLITDFQLKNKSIQITDKDAIIEETISYTDKVTLNYDEGNFSIHFAIPNFINSKKNSYKYRLKGLEEEWIHTTQNAAYYTIQNAGNYTFEVKGANNNEIWNTNATRLEIKVLPAPWKSWWAFLLYALAIVIALYFLITIQKSKVRLKHDYNLELLENEKKEENNKAKLDFFTNISHEFRTPLTLILGPLHQILEDYTGSSKMYKRLLVIESSANHLLSLINRLMDFRKLEKNLFKLEAAEGNIVKFLKEIYLSFSEYAKDGNYDYNFLTSANEILVYYDRYKLERVFYNLISNAFRYTPKKGKITVRITKDGNEILIAVEDSGVGISETYKDKIFDRFFEVDANNKPDKNYNKGTGIGLSIAKNIVVLHKGKINISNNTNNEGSIFTVALPLGKNHLLEDEISKDFKFSDDLSQYVSQLEKPNELFKDQIGDNIHKKDAATILLAEDNKPLRSFIKNILNKDYNIIEAENGEIALKMATKYNPNLIVSDVVMPVMDGTTLCTKIKKDIKTSHIPIILLTARTSLIYKLEGLESGADDYISKPFNLKEFKLRIKNILETSTKQKENLSANKTLLPSKVILSSLDEKLFEKAIAIVEENISNDAFDIPYFCSELGVSRTMLFVKIKAWTSFTPNEFIQHFRMTRAAQLLEQGKINISEVSYKVGFKNPKYFSKCFQKKFGETPTQYSNKFSDY
ncbi:two-component regulator propeller domain-containing protein [uncultured Polaribacter sp.]|uniref:hybrid sensor histidine kinase/response regulator transcription factor n=1 Tax=uncultured Polaribacter sp. TaxID=174711 RepID=UPI00262A1FC1|nr:two-component regulator propeller domain-containing protein [uncultured Polaribacter sp.]